MKKLVMSFGLVGLLAAACNSSQPAAYQTPTATQQQTTSVAANSQPVSPVNTLAPSQTQTQAQTTPAAAKIFKIPELGIQFQTKSTTDLYYVVAQEPADGLPGQVVNLGLKSLDATDPQCKADTKYGSMGMIQKVQQIPADDTARASFYKKVGSFYIFIHPRQDVCATSAKGKALLSSLSVFNPSSEASATVEVIK